MSMRDKYLLRDDTEGFFDVILFEEEISVEDLENFIRNYKKDNMGEWNIENIIEEIKSKYKVKEVMLFDYIMGNTGDICGDASLEYIEEAR